MSSGLAAGVGRVVFALGWSLTGVVMLAIVDYLAASPPGDGSGVVFLGVIVLFVLGLGAKKIVDEFVARSVLFATVVLAGFAFPCLRRMADAPLFARPRADVEPDMYATFYSGGALLAIAALTFAVAHGLQMLLRAREARRAIAASAAAASAPASSSASSKKPGIDAVLVATAAVSIVATGLVLVSWARLPTVWDLDDAPRVHASAEVPVMDASAESVDIMTEAVGVVSVVRTHPAPANIGRLTVDLRDGVGVREVPNVSVGDGEFLQLRSRGELLWELVYRAPQNEAREVVLVRFLRGHAERPEAVKVSDLRGELAPSVGVLGVTGLVSLMLCAVLVVTEVRRRRVLVVARGHDAVVLRSGQVERAGEVVALREPLRVGPGPVVLLGAPEDASDPYRAVRSADRAIAGTVEGHLRAHVESVTDARALALAIFFVGLAPAVAAALVGQLGF